MSIFGVDIASGSPAARRTPYYSLVILEGDSIASFHMISRHKLIRLIRERQPEMVAMDNLHELASNRRELIEILRRVPTQTRMVQVTGADHPEPLVKLARYHGITFDRTKPLQEAEACARLAARGVGVVLSAFQERTWIKVSRRRSLGRGGWSQNRYTRKIHGAVMGLAREVEQQLRESGLPYTSRAVQGLGATPGPSSWWRRQGTGCTSIPATTATPNCWCRAWRGRSCSSGRWCRGVATL